MADQESESEHFSPYRADGKLYGFVCVVTGASQPIGKAIVLELAAHGAAAIYACSAASSSAVASNAAITDFEALAKEVNAQYACKVIGYPLKPSEEDTLTLIDDVLNAWGRLDVWVTSSDLLGPPTIEETTPTDLQTLFEANSLAPFLALKYAPAAMRKTSIKGNYPNAAPKDIAYGSIIVVSSIANSHGCWGPAFTMSSHAALGVVRAGVTTLKGSGGVRINCISPGQIDVGQGQDVKGSKNGGVERAIGLERAGLPREVARVAGFLASGFSSYITGSNMVVDGGASAMNPLSVPI